MVRRQPGPVLTRCAVLGSPVAHSLSPLLHRAAYAHLGLDWEYGAAEVTGDGLAGFLDGLGPGWRGLSLTMPLKRVVLGLADTVDPVAATAGAANTLVFGPPRRGARPLRHAANTDVGGVAATLAGRCTDRVLVLGAGATAAAVLAALPAAARVTVLARDTDRAEAVRAVAERLARAVRVAPLDAAVDPPDLLVSTLPGGALDAATLAARGAAWLPDAAGTVLDAVYEGWPTPLARAARAAGVPVLGGVHLLVHQAVGQVALMTGRPVPPEVLFAALPAALL